jgi:hypothetical protein
MAPGDDEVELIAMEAIGVGDGEETDGHRRGDRRDRRNSDKAPGDPAPHVLVRPQRRGLTVGGEHRGVLRAGGWRKLKVKRTDGVERATKTRNARPRGQRVALSCRVWTTSALAWP